MTALLRAELIKLRTTRSFAATAGIAAGLSTVLVVLATTLAEPSKESVLVDVFDSPLGSLFILVLASAAISGEWRHRTITSSLLAAPDRTRFLAATTLAFAVAGIVLSLVTSIAVAAVGYAVLALRDLPVADFGEVADLAVRNAVIAALFGALAVGLGALVRNQVVAVVGVIAAMLMIGPVVTGLFPEAAPYDPFSGLPTSIQGLSPEIVGLGEVDLLPALPAVLLMLGWIGVAFAAAAVLLRRRDLI